MCTCGIVFCMAFVAGVCTPLDSVFLCCIHAPNPLDDLLQTSAHDACQIQYALSFLSITLKSALSSIPAHIPIHTVVISLHELGTVFSRHQTLMRHHYICMPLLLRHLLAIRHSYWYICQNARLSCSYKLCQQTLCGLDARSSQLQ